MTLLSVGNISHLIWTERLQQSLSGFDHRFLHGRKKRLNQATYGGKALKCAARSLEI